MRLNILIGGKAGQGINKVSGIVSGVLSKLGYFTFNYRDYPSIIRGGHNFNVLSISDELIESHESLLDVVVALDERTIETHKSFQKPGCEVIRSDQFKDAGKNLNVALAGVLIKLLGISFKSISDELVLQFKESKDKVDAAKKGFDSAKKKFTLAPLKKKISILSGSKAIAIGARNSGLDIYFGYPMTPATNALHELAKDQVKNNLMVFQAENEIAAVSMAIGASFSGAKVLTGTSGGGFDLMSETLSLQGVTQIPLTVYLASRPGPGTGIPTYTSQGDLNLALRAGHGEFPRIVVAPGNAIEQIEKASEALFLAEHFRILSIILSDKHLAESEFSSEVEPEKAPYFEVVRESPGSSIVKASSYESNEHGLSTESAMLAGKNIASRMKKYETSRGFIEEHFKMIKFHGKMDSKNLIIGWGSTSGAIKDAIKGLDVKFLQVLYVKPLSSKIKEEIERADKVILIECNATGQLGRLIREKTGFKIKNRILKYNGRPFYCDELQGYLKKVIGG